MMCGIYRLRNRLTGAVYIGSSVNIPSRVKAHLKQLANGRHDNHRLQDAWDVDGASAFSVGVLELTESTSEALIAAEQRWMDTNAAGGVDLYNGLLSGRLGRGDSKRRQSPRVVCLIGACGAPATHRVKDRTGRNHGSYCRADAARMVAFLSGKVDQESPS